MTIIRHVDADRLQEKTVGRLTPAAARALDRALREALSDGCNYISTAHILRALIATDGEAKRAIEVIVEGAAA